MVSTTGTCPSRSSPALSSPSRSPYGNVRLRFSARERRRTPPIKTTTIEIPDDLARQRDAADEDVASSARLALAIL
jgi:hypothetical protein